MPLPSLSTHPRDVLAAVLVSEMDVALTWVSFEPACSLTLPISPSRTGVTLHPTNRQTCTVYDAECTDLGMEHWVTTWCRAESGLDENPGRRVWPCAATLSFYTIG